MSIPLRRFRSLVIILLSLLVVGIALLHHHTAVNHQFLMAVAHQNTRLAQASLEHGADVDARYYPADKTVPVYDLAARFKFVRPPYGMTALMMAAINHDCPTAKYLLDHGADVNAVSSEFDAMRQVTALWLAREDYRYATQAAAGSKLRHIAKDKPSEVAPMVVLLEISGGKA